GGRLSVTARAVEGGIETAVADTGTGIPPEQLSRVMEPLYSTKARGLGLGLSIARAILEKNGGSLRVVSEPGKGGTFTVFLQTDCTEETPSEGRPRLPSSSSTTRSIPAATCRTF